MRSCTALAMTYAGAAGETEAEMAKTLHFELLKDELHDGMRALWLDWTTPVFRADHPFVFMIRDNRNGAILFLGRITNPSE